MKRSLFALLLVPAAMLLSTTAKAEPAVDNFDPQHSFRPAEFPWESGFFPSSGPLQVNLVAAAYQEVDIEMYGSTEYEFDDGEITFIGTDDSGVFNNALGIEVSVVIAIDFIIQTEFEVGVYNIEETANAAFTPYLLPGHPDRPVSASEAIGPNNLVNTDFTVPGFGIPGNLNIDWTLNVPGIEFRSTHIDIHDDGDSSIASLLGVYDQEYSDLPIMLPEDTPGETAEVHGTLHGTFDSEISLDFDVTVTVVVSGQELAIGPITVTLDYPLLQDEPVIFEPELIEFDIPIPEPEGTSTGMAESSSGPAADDSSSGDEPESSSSTSGGESNSGSTSTTMIPVDDTTGAVSDTDGIPADNPGNGSSGCGCNSGPGGSGMIFLGLFGLAFARRRTRKTDR